MDHAGQSELRLVRDRAVRSRPQAAAGGAARRQARGAAGLAGAVARPPARFALDCHREDKPMDHPETRADQAAGQHLPQRLHHNAFVVRDQELNRRFFEDVLGMPLVATWCERMVNTELQREVAYCHTFFGLADGGALAFFQFADQELYERSKALFPEIGRFNHIALKVDPSTYTAITPPLDPPPTPPR